MADHEVRLIISGDGSGAVAATKEVSAAYKALSTSTIADIEARKDVVTAAYTTIKNSGTASASEIRQAEIAKNNAIKKLNEELLGSHQSLTDGIKQNWLGISAAVATGMIAFTKVKDYVTQTFDYLGRIETASLGIASSYMVGGKYVDAITGKVLEGERSLKAAQQDSRQIMQELQVANFQTIATLDQLVRAYQETLPVAMAKGFDRKQVKDFTVAMVQAAGAIGLPLDQMGEETRSILTGSINPRTSRIATVLGLRNEDITALQGDAQKLFSFLMNKLDAYKIAGIESQTTWSGLTSNMKDIYAQIGGMALDPLFQAIKDHLRETAGHIVTVDEKAKKLEWNKDFLKGIETIKEGIREIIAEIRRFAMFLDKVGGTLTQIGALKAMAGRNADEWVKYGLSATEDRPSEKYWLDRNKEYLERYRTQERALMDQAEKQLGFSRVPEKELEKYNYTSPGQDPDLAIKRNIHSTVTETGQILYYWKDINQEKSKYVTNPPKLTEDQKKAGEEWGKILRDLHTQVDKTFADELGGKILDIENKYEDLVHKAGQMNRGKGAKLDTGYLDTWKTAMIEHLTRIYDTKIATEAYLRLSKEGSELYKLNLTGENELKKTALEIDKERINLELDLRETTGEDVALEQIREKYEYQRKTLNLQIEESVLTATLNQGNEVELKTQWNKQQVLLAQLNALDEREKLERKITEIVTARNRVEAETRNRLALTSAMDTNKVGSKAGNIETQIDAYQRLLEVYQTNLLAVPQNSQAQITIMDKIYDAKLKLYELGFRLDEQTGGFFKGASKGLQEYLYEMKSTFQTARDLVKDSATQMQKSLEDYFYSPSEFSTQDMINSFRRLLARAQAELVMGQAKDALLKLAGGLPPDNIVSKGLDFLGIGGKDKGSLTTTNTILEDIRSLLAQSVNQGGLNSGGGMPYMGDGSRITAEDVVNADESLAWGMESMSTSVDEMQALMGEDGSLLTGLTDIMGENGSFLSGFASIVSSFLGLGKGGGGIIGSIGDLLGFREGGVFSHGSVIPFANGDIVTRPTLFPMARGKVGLMGEAGEEAIMPLTRTSSGELGVRASGGSSATPSSVSIVFEDHAGVMRNATAKVKSIRDDRALDRRILRVVIESKKRGGALNDIFPSR